MKNRHVGYLIISISALMAFMILSFNRAMNEIVGTACTHGPSCPMWGTIRVQTSISLAMMGFVALVGLYFVFMTKNSGQERAATVARNMGLPKGLNQEEKQILEMVTKADGSIFQSELVEKSGFPKVKVSRLLDRLEGRGLIERKRRGMTNVVIRKAQ